MAEIYTKAAENTLILESREMMLRQFNFGTWTEMRMGMYFGGVNASGNNVNSVNESVTLTSALDRICFGIKDSSTTTIPGQTGAQFLGVTTTTGQLSKAGNDGVQGIIYSNGALSPVGTVDTTITGGSVAGAPMQYPIDITGSSAYCGFYALKFVINNAGLSSQTVTITSTNTVTIAGSAYTVNNLRALINSATYGGSATIAWNNGATANAIPNCWFLRLPFLNNRIRISAIDMIKIS